MFHITMSYRTSQRTFFPFALLLAICHVEAAYLDGIAMLNFLIYYDTFISLCNLHPYYFYDAPINLRLILFYSLTFFSTSIISSTFSINSPVRTAVIRFFSISHCS